MSTCSGSGLSRQSSRREAYRFMPPPLLPDTCGMGAAARDIRAHAGDLRRHRATLSARCDSARLAFTGGDGVSAPRRRDAGAPGRMRACARGGGGSAGPACPYRAPNAWPCLRPRPRRSSTPAPISRTASGADCTELPIGAAGERPNGPDGAGTGVGPRWQRRGRRSIRRHGRGGRHVRPRCRGCRLGSCLLAGVPDECRGTGGVGARPGRRGKIRRGVGARARRSARSGDAGHDVCGHVRRCARRSRGIPRRRRHRHRVPTAFDGVLELPRATWRATGAVLETGSAVRGLNTLVTADPALCDTVGGWAATAGAGSGPGLVLQGSTTARRGSVIWACSMPRPGTAPKNLEDVLQRAGNPQRRAATARSTSGSSIAPTAAGRSSSTYPARSRGIRCPPPTSPHWPRTSGRCGARQTSYSRGVLDAMTPSRGAPGRAGDARRAQRGRHGGGTGRDRRRASKEFDVTHVVTAGAPIGRFAGEIPDAVQVLAIENKHDIVPASGRAREPTAAEHHHRRRSNHDHHTVLANHDIEWSYLPGAGDIEASRRSVHPRATSPRADSASSTAPACGPTASGDARALRWRGDTGSVGGTDGRLALSAEVGKHLSAMLGLMQDTR